MRQVLEVLPDPVRGLPAAAREASRESAGAPDLDLAQVRVAVLIPCYNEALTIAQVVRDFSAALPCARIYVYDNNSTDQTAKRAAEAGALVRSEPLQGKGHVVRRMFRDIDADLYVLVDGDATYDASAAPLMLRTALAGPYDLVNAVRQDAGHEADHAEAYRAGHRVGNQLLTGMVKLLFGNRVQDMLSGYKVLSRRFVKSFPVLANGFEIETELTVHALELRMPIAHVTSQYRSRPAGSASKLKTVADGRRILAAILALLKQERPLLFFSCIALLLAAASIADGTPVIVDYMRTGLVPRMPSAVLSTGLMLVAFISLTCGLILDTVTRGRREAKMLYYLREHAACPGDADSSWAPRLANGSSAAAIHPVRAESRASAGLPTPIAADNG